eukprot:1225821-Amphidinium_carterae.1
MEAARLGPMIPDRATYLEHIRDGHNPKAVWCPACQLGEGPVFAHRKLKKSEVGCLSIDVTGPVTQDIMKCKYALVAAWVTVGPPKGNVVGVKTVRTQSEIRRDLKEREIVLPFVRPLTTRDATE